MRVVVTGSSGQIGSFVVESLRARGATPVGVDRRASPATEHVGDVNAPGVLERALERADAVVHCAAHVSVQGSVEDPRADAMDNVLGTIAVLEAARRRGIGRVVHVSSAAVYGAPLRVPLDEEHPRRPLSPYGASKLASESYASLFAGLHGLSVVTVRPFNVYSARQDPSNPYAGVMSRFAARIVAGLPPVVYGDGSQTRDFVHASDVAAFLVRLALDEPAVSPGTVMNLGGGEETSVDALARRFLAAAGRPEAGIVREAARPGEIHRSCADVSLARKWGFRTRVTLDEGIREMLTGAGVRAP